MGDQWHYSRSGQQAGPVTSAQLKQLADRGELAPTDLVWKTGLAEWVRASKIRGLFASTGAAPMMPPPVPAPPPESPGGVSAESSGKPVTAVEPNATVLVAGVHPQRIAIAVAALVGMAVAFFPWLVTHVSETTGGWLHIALCAPALVMSFIGSRSQPVIGLQRLIAVVPSMVPVALAVRLMGQVYWQVEDIKRLQSSSASWPRGLAGRGSGMDTMFDGASIAIGWGVYVAIGAAIAMLLAAWHLARPSVSSSNPRH